MKNIFNKSFCLLFIAYCLFSFSSCISIEKRKFRDGYYIEWASHKHKATQPEQKKEKEIENNFDSVSSATPILFSAANDSSPKILTEKKNKIQFSKIVFVEDTLPEKKNDLNSKDEKGKVSSQRKTPALAIIGFSLFFLFLTLLAQVDIFQFLGIVVSDVLSSYLLGIGILAFIAGLVISIIAIHKIKKHRDKYKGMGFAIAGLVLPLATLLALLIGLIVLIILFS